MKNKKLLFLISLGAILEYYDFAIYIYLAPYIGKSLIIANNPNLNLFLSYLILAIGAFFRPLGGMIFAHFGDKTGRSKTFVYTILFMALPTFLLAVIPNTTQIGVYATVLLIILRIFQGFAVGGEIPGSIVFGYEIAPKKRKAIYAAIVILGINIGFILASFTCQILLHYPDKNSYFASWRYAYLIGGVFGIISYFLRKNIVETAEFLSYKKNLAASYVPIRTLFSNYKNLLLQILNINMFLAASLAVFTFYMPAYLSLYYHFPLPKLMQFNSYMIIIFCMGSIIAGVFDQYFGKFFFLLTIPIFIVGVFILFLSYAKLSLTEIFLAHILVLTYIGIICGRIPVLSATFFPVKVRYSGVAIVYNVSFGVVAGLTQAVLTGIIGLTHLVWLPALYILLFAVLAFIMIIKIPAHKFVDYI